MATVWMELGSISSTIFASEIDTCTLITRVVNRGISIAISLRRTDDVTHGWIVSLTSLGFSWASNCKNPTIVSLSKKNSVTPAGNMDVILVRYQRSEQGPDTNVESANERGVPEQQQTRFFV